MTLPPSTIDRMVREACELERGSANECWFIEIQHPLDGRWTRVGKPYREKATARSWVSFVRAYWHGAKARVVKVKLETVK